MKQILYVDPDKKIIIIRTGEIGDVELGFIHKLAKKL